MQPVRLITAWTDSPLHPPSGIGRTGPSWVDGPNRAHDTPCHGSGLLRALHRASLLFRMFGSKHRAKTSICIAKPEIHGDTKQHLTTGL